MLSIITVLALKVAGIGQVLVGFRYSHTRTAKLLALTNRRSISNASRQMLRNQCFDSDCLNAMSQNQCPKANTRNQQWTGIKNPVSTQGGNGIRFGRERRILFLRENPLQPTVWLTPIPPTPSEKPDVRGDLAKLASLIKGSLL